jgi:hypothetical protein
MASIMARACAYSRRLYADRAASNDLLAVSFFWLSSSVSMERSTAIASSCRPGLRIASSASRRAVDTSPLFSSWRAFSSSVGP